MKKKRAKPFKAWAVFTRGRLMDAGYVYRTKKEAARSLCFDDEDVRRIEIREIQAK